MSLDTSSTQRASADFFGTVIGFEPLCRDGPALYRVRYAGDDKEDDDEEELDEGELQNGLRQWAKEEVRRRQKGQQMPVGSEQLMLQPLPLPQRTRLEQQQILQERLESPPVAESAQSIESTGVECQHFECEQHHVPNQRSCGCDWYSAVEPGHLVVDTRNVIWH